MKNSFNLLKHTMQSNKLQIDSYLKDFFIKYSSSKHYNSFGIDDGVGASEQLLGGLLFTVQNESDGLLVHADGHSMPPGMGGKVNSHTYWVTRPPARSQSANRLRAPFCVSLVQIQIRPLLFLKRSLVLGGKNRVLRRRQGKEKTV